MKKHLNEFTGKPKIAEGYENLWPLVSSSTRYPIDSFFIDPLRNQGHHGGGGAFPQRCSGCLSLRMGRSVASVVRSCVPEKRVAQMMDHFTQYVGSSPINHRRSFVELPTCRPMKESGTRSVVHEPFLKLWRNLPLNWVQRSGCRQM